MRIIISPAKKMREDTDSLPYFALPQFLPETAGLMALLQSMPPEEQQALWKCNASIARLNTERLVDMDLRRNLTPAILSYEGIQYRYMAPGVLEQVQLDFLQEHLRILSGFYGLLRPFDGVTPYRLEMQAGLAAEGHGDLYSFWGNKLAHQLTAETAFILNLASKEYSKAVASHLPKTVHFLTCTFGALQNGKVTEKGTLCKMARGQMVRWLAEHQVTQAEDMKHFCDLGYAYEPARSTADNFVFLK